VLDAAPLPAAEQCALGEMALVDASSQFWSPAA
jgi:hypothetical protein